VLDLAECWQKTDQCIAVVVRLRTGDARSRPPVREPESSLTSVRPRHPSLPEVE